MPVDPRPYQSLKNETEALGPVHGSESGYSQALEVSAPRPHSAPPPSLVPHHDRTRYGSLLCPAACAQDPQVPLPNLSFLAPVHAHTLRHCLSPPLCASRDLGFRHPPKAGCCTAEGFSRQQGTRRRGSCEWQRGEGRATVALGAGATRYTCTTQLPHPHPPPCLSPSRPNLYPLHAPPRQTPLSSLPGILRPFLL
ncbi:hypothetical protein E2C01_068737 [Portunus trituberculatus]|uniref:Uncharacterized protein n=1 Tax=Portunus trituberculatus TaxID=210409 RepID=A0A5B7HX95_PORTR|nr:hypothetical protein [Portunus trituberculatus]